MKAEEVGLLLPRGSAGFPSLCTGGLGPECYLPARPSLSWLSYHVCCPLRVRPWPG